MEMQADDDEAEYESMEACIKEFTNREPIDSEDGGVSSGVEESKKMILRGTNKMWWKEIKIKLCNFDDKSGVKVWGAKHKNWWKKWTNKFCGDNETSTSTSTSSTPISTTSTETCGGSGQPCCAGDDCTAAGTVCDQG